MASRPSDSPENQEAQPHEKIYPPHPQNQVFVGTKKPAMSYAIFALQRLTELDEVVIRARGLPSAGRSTWLR